MRAPLAIALAGATLVAGGACSTQHPKPVTVAAVLAVSHHHDVPEPPTTTTVAPTTTVAHTAAVQPWPKAPHIQAMSSGRCGGDLPPCSVMYCESGGKLVDNGPMTRWGTAKGKWQILDSTWRNQKDGYKASDGKVYPTANDAPESVQDERARSIYAGGAGRSQWSC